MPNRPFLRLAAMALTVLTIAAGSVAVDGLRPRGAASAACSIGTTLRVGSTGADVRCLQARLNQLGFGAGPVDGQFGPMTRGAVVRFQRARRLAVDGVVGRRTARALGIWAAACRPPAGTPGAARRIVVVTASGTAADVDLLVKRHGVWRCRRTDMHGRVGRNGVRPLLQRRSGDGTTPAGVFALGTMRARDGQSFQFFGNGANPGVHGTWRQVRSGDCWGATPGTPRYNRLVRRAAWNCRSPDEYLPNITGAYSQAALIGANLGPNRSGDDPGEIPYAAAIFLHRHSYDGNGVSRPTSGCVSLAAGDLAFVLRRLVPGRTWFVIRSG
jgi:L,D-peptidoglycan transpeptidase YkuD (ErfK/YbiS/YcfS/YnhG family)